MNFLTIPQFIAEFGTAPETEDVLVLDAPNNFNGGGYIGKLSSPLEWQQDRTHDDEVWVWPIWANCPHIVESERILIRR